MSRDSSKWTVDRVFGSEPTDADFDTFARCWRTGRAVPAPVLWRIRPQRPDHIRRLRQRGVALPDGPARPR